MKCVICTDRLNPNEKISYLDGCKIHAFHEKCITRWNIENNTCPVCRRKFNNILNPKPKSQIKEICQGYSCVLLICICILIVLWILRIIIISLLSGERSTLKNIPIAPKSVTLKKERDLIPCSYVFWNCNIPPQSLYKGFCDFEIIFLTFKKSFITTHKMEFRKLKKFKWPLGLMDLYIERWDNQIHNLKYNIINELINNKHTNKKLHIFCHGPRLEWKNV